MNIKKYDADIFDLRRKPTEREYLEANGKVYYTPHLACTASEWARFWKVLSRYEDLFGTKKSPYFKRDFWAEKGKARSCANRVFVETCLRVLEIALRDLDDETYRGEVLRALFKDIADEKVKMPMKKGGK